MGVRKRRDRKARNAPATSPDALDPPFIRPADWWRSLSEDAANIITVVSPEGIVEYINHPVSGLDIQDVVGRKVTEFVDPAFHGRLFEKLGEVLKTGEATSFTSRAAGPHGTVSWYDNQLSPVLLEGEVVSVAFIATDITASHEAEEERRSATETLQAERDRIQAILDLVGDIVLVLETDGTVGVINRQGCEILGYLPDEVVGRNWFDHFLPERVREEVKEVFSRLIAGEIELVRVHENPVLNASGQEREIEWRNSALYDEDGRIRNIISSGTDITDRQDLEKLLRQAQKMEAIGRLAGGIAHDFNNLLTVITASVELARLESDPAQIDSRLETIAGASRTAAELTTQLLTFSSRQPVIPVLTLLDRAITESMRILSRTVGEDIVVRIEHREPDLPVMIDPAQLSQILMNLVLNARDAMPAGGALTITTSQVELTAEHVAAGGIAAPGTFARLTVTDTGQGMDDEQKTRLFEPFFTTKELGKGTGLGMATVYGIVNQNAGFIEVESAPGTGTTMLVFLPRAAYEPLPTGSTDEVDMIPGGSERIVLVEDDAAVRDLTVEILTEKGYTVMTFTDPEKALEAFVGMTAETLPDLLITDVVMPRMSGVELVRRLEEMDCRPRVLLISGYTDDALARRGLSGEHYELLSKPFTLRQLCARVRELLDR